MSKKDKLLAEALNAPANMRFADLCSLAEMFGFICRKVNGSHRIYKREGYRWNMNFQDDDGRAKPYQVRQLLDALRDVCEIE